MYYSHLYNSILAKIYYLSILNGSDFKELKKKSECKIEKPICVLARGARAHTLRTYVASAVGSAVARQWFRRRARRTCVRRCRSAARASAGSPPP